VILTGVKPEEMFGRGKSEGKIGRIGQTFLPFAPRGRKSPANSTPRGRKPPEFAPLAANGSFVWPLLQESLAAFASKMAKFTEKTPGNYKKVWPSCRN
jgi:hypothetical protein